jgi:hypothetical protein
MSLCNVLSVLIVCRMSVEMQPEAVAGEMGLEYDEPLQEAELLRKQPPFERYEIGRRARTRHS